MSYSSEILADSPRAWYRTQEASGQLQDSSGNGNHTTATTGAGSCTYQQTSPIISDPTAKGIRLNANFAFTAPDHSTLDLGDIFSLEAWVKMTDLFAAGEYIVSKQAGAYSLDMEPTSGNKVMVLVQPNVAVIVDSSTNFAINNTTDWFHVVNTKNGASVNQYLNGVNVTGTVTNSTFTDNSSDLAIGVRIVTDVSGFFNSFLAEVAVYGTELSQARVRAHFNAATAFDTAIAWLTA